MKNFIMIGGTMGVGKSKTSEELLHSLDNCVWLDGDWCWRMSPFVVNEENKNMVLDNIAFILNNYLKNSTLENIVFSWVMDEDKIINDVIKRIEYNDINIIKISLVCGKEELEKRINKDCVENNRSDREIEKSFERVKCYTNLDTIKLDTSNMRVDDVVVYIKKLILEYN